MLSIAAVDAALMLAKVGGHLLSEALTVKARAALGQGLEGGGGGSGTGGKTWDEYTGKQRLSEVMGRMQGDRGLLERLLLAA